MPIIAWEMCMWELDTDKTDTMLKIKIVFFKFKEPVNNVQTIYTLSTTTGILVAMVLADTSILIINHQS